jgi:proteic killer suppression protein
MADRIARRLDAIDAATDIHDLDVPGFGLHELKGDRAGTWSIRVSGNFRITFSFESGDATGLDLADYH